MTNEQIIKFNTDKICFEVHAESLSKVIMAIGGQCNKQMYIEDITPCKHYKESMFRVHFLDNEGIRSRFIEKSESTECEVTDECEGRRSL